MPTNQNIDVSSNGKKTPRLFYFEEACNAFVPLCNDLQKSLDNIIDIEGLADGETLEISFKRVDMTDAELDALPEA